LAFNILALPAIKKKVGAMRSLTPTGLQVASLTDLCKSGHVAALAIDAESGDVAIAVERKAEEGSVEVDVIQIRSTEEDETTPKVSRSWKVLRTE